MFPISEQRYTVGKLLEEIECQIHLHTGTSKSFMSKLHYLSVNLGIHYQNLHQKLKEFK